MNVRYIKALAIRVHTILIKPIPAREGSAVFSIPELWLFGVCGDIPDVAHQQDTNTAYLFSEWVVY